MTDFAVMDYMDVVNGQLDLMEACTECPQIPNLFFLAAPAAYDPVEPAAGKMKAMFDKIRNEFDYCINDSPSGVGVGFKLATSNADMVVITTVGEIAAMRDAQLAASQAQSLGVDDLRLLVNRVLPKNLKIIRTNIDDVIDAVGIRLIGIVLEDKAVFRALHASMPLVLYKKRLAAYDFLDIARRITGEDVPLLQR